MNYPQPDDEPRKPELKHRIFKGLAIIGGIGAIVGGYNTYAGMATYSGPPHVARALPSVNFVDPGQALPPAHEEGVAVVKMREILDSHPLAKTLAADDRQIYALNLAQGTPRTAVDGAKVAALQKKLQAQLQSVAATAQKKLNERAKELSIEERRETAALLAAASRDRKNANLAADVINSADKSMSNIALDQRHKFAAGINAEMRAAVLSAQAGLDLQAKSALEAKAGQYSQEESDLAAQLARKNGQERINLRLKQSNPKISAEERTAIDARLAELNAADNAALFAKRADDKKHLLELAADFREHRANAATTVAAGAGAAGRGALQTQNEIAPLPVQTPVARIGATPAPIDANLRSRVGAIHQKYQGRFDAEQKASVAAFQAKRADFQGQLNALTGAAGNAQAQSAQELQRLHRDRDQVFASMVQNVRAVATQVAAERHMRVVIIDPVANVDATDLTDDVKRRLNAMGK